MNSTTEQNKATVIRFNREIIEQGNWDSFNDLVSNDVFNHTAPPGTSTGKDGMINFLKHILRTGFTNLKVEIIEQIAERDLVTTRKKISGTHTTEVLGIPASNRNVVINIIDIIRLKDDKYVEHWAHSNFSDVIAQIAK